MILAEHTHRRWTSNASRSLFAILAVIAIIAIDGSAAEARLAIRDDRGVTVTLDASPRRIVSLLPS